MPDAGGDAAVPPWAGPFLTVLSTSAGVYAEPAADRRTKIGYARNGGRLPVKPEKLQGAGCRSGWYAVIGGGFICANEGTTNADDPRARLAGQEPNLNDILPYPYARNAYNGTPLYSSVPSRDQMEAYEPYLTKPVEESPAMARDAGARVWWQREEAKLGEVRLAELETESDGIIAKRMVKGFYVAVDEEFDWSSRRWYKTTKGMVVPKDRFAAVEPPAFSGIQLAEQHALPVAWGYGSRKQRPRYEITDAGIARPRGEFQPYRPLHLTGERREVAGHAYALGTDGFWIRTDHVRIAEAPPVPEGLASDERWIHVELGTQTLVASIGTRPVYATLVSSGKESDDRALDHRTPTGEWTIREKHITTTMDGDGAAAGDLPYSIEDVPYAMYFQGSYALHGAFWHRNFGVRMSHGCINLAPLDAKYLFFFSGPEVQPGWHGAWAGNGRTGARLVIHGPPRESSAGR